MKTDNFQGVDQYCSVIAYCDLCSYGSQSLRTEEEVKEHIREKHADVIDSGLNSKTEGDNDE